MTEPYAKIVVNNKSSRYSSGQPSDVALQKYETSSSRSNRINAIMNGRKPTTQSGGRKKYIRKSGKKQYVKKSKSLKKGGSRRSKSGKRQVKGIRKSHRKSSNSKRNKRGGGRTLNVPTPSTPFKMPGPSPNNAWYVGEPCVGAHCGVAMTPTVNNLHNSPEGLGSTAHPGSNHQYPVIDRLGNSPNETLTGLQAYQGTAQNPGPFNTQCVGGGKRKKNRKSPSRKSRSANRKNKKN